MARIELVDLAHSYQPDRASWALQPMTLTWRDGGAYALLGPSGCGKSTLLNIISGLLTPTQGAVMFDGRNVTSAPPQARNIAQVFQFPVVYDTLSVFDNLAFPLRNRGWKRAAIAQRVGEIAELLELTDLRARAHGLSADARQKISLGRGLVRPDVAAVLFDEPLTVIDPQLKWLLRRKLKQIHQQLKLTLIYVTHDQTEALTFADEVAVMSAGAVVQVGAPEDLFETPAHRFVGRFIGSPGMNFLACRWDGAAVVADARLATASTAAPPPDAALEIGVRPEYVEVCDAPGPNRVPVRVTAVHDHGTQRLIEMQGGGRALWGVLRDGGGRPRLGEAFAYLPPEKCALYANERRLA